MSNDKQTKLNVSLTQDYRLTSDGSQFILQERRTVDPTKSPNWTKLAANGADPSIREEWRDIGFYGFTAKGLSAAVVNVTMRIAAQSDAEDLREFIDVINRTSKTITDGVESQIHRPDSVKPQSIAQTKEESE
ncbi:hypothetical protein NQ117_05580 [Paenibacillus sp. SC116]|uniref:hypothetical protein n=1 Tax=Paenibacillus sp. SC116 TaxID=2968986 RepID=UPI00215A9A4D|nr:hypothetical protein [Paenibacillus sp. SC116]MCR8843144.1 hypothetical protein [Paenibacillus sp. SC116]